MSIANRQHLSRDLHEGVEAVLGSNLSANIDRITNWLEVQTMVKSRAHEPEPLESNPKVTDETVKSRRNS